MANNMADELGHGAKPALTDEISIAYPVDVFFQHRRATSSTISHGQVAPNGHSQSRRASAFTAPTPAARLLGRFGISAPAVRSNVHIDPAARAQPAAARRPSAVGSGRETSRTQIQSGSNLDTQSTIIHHFSDLLDGRSSRPAATSQATPAWRPGGGPRTAAAAATTGTSGRAPPGAGSYVSRAAAATAARARETSRQVAGQGYASRLLAADGRQAPAATALWPVASVPARTRPSVSEATPKRPSRAPTTAVSTGKKTISAAPPRLQSASSSPAALSPAARRPSAAASPVTAAAAAAKAPRQGAATSALQPAGSVGSAAARQSPRPLTYTEWLEAQTRSPAAPPQWRSPNDRTATPTSTTAQRGPGPQADARAPASRGSATATSSGAGAGAVPRTPPPMTPSTGRSGCIDGDTSSAYSTPTAHSPAAASGPPVVARRLHLPSNSSTSRELSFLEPRDSDSGRDSAEIAGGGGGSSSPGGSGGSGHGGSGGSGAWRLPGGFGSRHPSDANLGNEPSITSLATGGRLRVATRILPDGGGDGDGSGGDSPRSPASSGSRLVFPGAAAVAAAVSSLGVRHLSAAAGNSGGAGDGTPWAGPESALPAELSGQGSAGRGAGGDGPGAAGQLVPEEPSRDDPASTRKDPAAAYEGYKGTRLHDYLHHHRQELSGRDTYAGETYDDGVTGGSGSGVAGAAGACFYPSERVEYGISGTDTYSEMDDDSDGASILLDDMVRQASVTGVMQMSTGGTMRRMSSRGAGASALLSSAPGGRASSGSSAFLISATAAGGAAGKAPANVRPQRSASAHHVRLGLQAKAQLQRASSGLVDRARESGGADSSPKRSSRGVEHEDPAAGAEPGPSVPRSQAWTGPSRTLATPDPHSTNPRNPWEVQSLESVRPAGSAAGSGGDGGGEGTAGAADLGSRGNGRTAPIVGGAGAAMRISESQPAVPGAYDAGEPSAREGAVPPSLVTHGSFAAPERVRSFRLRMTSEWVSEGEDGGSSSTGVGGGGGRGDGAGGGGGGGEVSQGSAPASPPHRGQAGKPASPPPPQQLQQEPVWAPLGAARSAAAGGTASTGAAAPAHTQHNQPPMQQQDHLRQPYRQLSVVVPPPPRPPLPPMQHQSQVSSPTGRPPFHNGDGNDYGSGYGRQMRSLSAPRGSIASSRGWGPPVPVPAPGQASASRQSSLTSLARELRDSVRSRGSAPGARPAWATASRASAGQLLPLPVRRGSHGTLNSPLLTASEAHGGAVRGSISGASTFSALSGPQAGVMYNYPSHGYMERAAEHGRWEAALLYDMDLYNSMQIQGFPTPDEYDDPSYVTRSQSSLPPSGVAARPFAPPRPASAIDAAAPPADRSLLPGVPRRHMPLRRTVSASAAMLAAAAANAAAQAGSFPGPGLTRGSVLPRSMVRSSRSWSPLRFSSSSAGGMGSPMGRAIGDAVPEALDQILEEESSGRLSIGAGPQEQPIPDGLSPNPSGDVAAGPPALTSGSSFGSSPREPSLGGWSSFRRQPSYQRSGSGDGRMNFNNGGNGPYGSGRESTERQQPPPGVLYAPQAIRPVAPPPLDAPRPLDGPLRCPSPQLLPVSEPDDGPQLPFPCSTAAIGSGDGGVLSYTNPLAASAAAGGPDPRPARPQSASPSGPFNHGLSSGPETSPSTVQCLSHASGGAQPYGPGAARASPGHACSHRTAAGWPSPSPPPPPHVPPNIPEEILSHPLSGLTGLSPYSSAAGSAMAAIAQAQPLQQRRRQQLQEPALRDLNGGSSEPGFARSVASAPLHCGAPASTQPPTHDMLPQFTRGPNDPGGGAMTAAGPGSSSPAAASYGLAGSMTVAAPAAGSELLAPGGSTGSSSGSACGSSDHPAQMAVVGGATPAAAAPGAAPLRPSYRTPPVEWLVRAGREPGPGIRTSQEQPLPYQPDGGLRGSGRSFMQGPAGRYPLDTVAPYPPPSLESIQRLLDTDLPSPAIAAAVAVLAGSLPHSWVRQQPPQGEHGWLPHTSQRPPDPTARAAAPASLRPAAVEAGAASLTAGTRSALPDVPATAPVAAAALDGARLPLVHGAGRSGPMSSRSYMALLTLAGERGMPPKPLQEEPEPTAPAAAAAAVLAAGATADGRAVTGVQPDLAAVPVIDDEGGSRRAGIVHIVDGPLWRAVRLIAQSMLIVLAGAAGATAAASSANAIFMRPEDLPYEHGTSIYYTKYPRNKRLARALQR